jgi:hypothetical protein
MMVIGHLPLSLHAAGSVWKFRGQRQDGVM